MKRDAISEQSEEDGLGVRKSWNGEPNENIAYNS
jgi:hypothetical protein